MGDPKKQRRKYSGPKILWNKGKIDTEKALLKEYGMKNKKELWRMESVLKKYTQNAKKLIPLKSKQAELEKQQLLKKLVDYGLLPQTAKLEDVLGLALKDILERRLQTIIFKQGLARSVSQARQFITHEHLFVGDKRITAPSYLIKVSEESQIYFDSASSLNDSEHPERTIIEKKEEPKPKKKKGGKRQQGRKQGGRGRKQPEKKAKGAEKKPEKDAAKKTESGDKK